MKKSLRLLFYCLFAAAVVIADQVTKLLVLDKIPLNTYVEAIKGLFFEYFKKPLPFTGF